MGLKSVGNIKIKQRASVKVKDASSREVLKFNFTSPERSEILLADDLVAALPDPLRAYSYLREKLTDNYYNSQPMMELIAKTMVEKRTFTDKDFLIANNLEMVEELVDLGILLKEKARVRTHYRTNSDVPENFYAFLLKFNEYIYRTGEQIENMLSNTNLKEYRLRHSATPQVMGSHHLIDVRDTAQRHKRVWDSGETNDRKKNYLQILGYSELKPKPLRMSDNYLPSKEEYENFHQDLGEVRQEILKDMMETDLQKCEWLPYVIDSDLEDRYRNINLRTPGGDVYCLGTEDITMLAEIYQKYGKEIEIYSPESISYDDRVPLLITDKKKQPLALFPVARNAVAKTFLATHYKYDDNPWKE